LIFLVKAACTTILDEIRGSYAAFRVTSKYSGPTVQIRRGNDDSTLNFYANKQGQLGTSLDGSGTSLTQWLGGWQGYVVIWYDQSGQGRHATQYTASSQPIFDPLNKRIDFTVQSGTAFLNLPDGTVPQRTQYTVTVKHNNINEPDGAWLSGGMTYIDLGSNGFRRMSSSYRNWWWANDIDADGYASGNTVTFQYDGSARRAYVNGVYKSTLQSSAWNGAVGNEYIGKCPGWPYLNGELYFLHIFASSLDDQSRTLVESGLLESCPIGILHLSLL
jgi:hypothetical protein